MFIRKYWIPLSVFIIAIVGVSLYYLQTRPPKDPIVIYKPVEPLPKPIVEKSEIETEAPVAETAQGGHSHEDGTFHAEPHEMPSDVPQSEDIKFESDAEFKARIEKYNAEMASAKSAREQTRQ